jgi:bifunctional oligoribonuclease and PAP phosphatase NrnA
MNPRKSNSALHTKIRKRIAAAQTIMVTTHLRPDGDALGALLGLGLALEATGRAVHMVSLDGVPSTFKHLPGSARVLNKPKGPYDLTIAVDCADHTRAGDVFEGLGQPGINIDHHITNDNFAEINLIEVGQAATCAILFDHLTEWGLALTYDIASALLTGIITDTLGFRTTSTTPHVLRQAADLLETGVDMSELYMRGLVRKSFNAARYWGAGLSSLQHLDGITWATLKLEDRQVSGYSTNDDADLINMLSAVDDSSVAIIFVEQHHGKVKISWRAQKPGLDVAAVAQQFGGGGHKAASGAELTGEMPEVQEKVLATTRQLLGL